MSENILKKEFTKQDVTRIRNLVTKKYGDSTRTQSGYTKSYVKHSEGEIWEENGKTWTIINGIKQNITKLDEFKQLAAIPLLCPNCSNSLKTEYDKKMYRIHSKCLNCVVKYETQLKIEGKYEEYAEKIIKGNINYYLNDYEQVLNELENSPMGNFISEDGVVEKWIGDNKNVIKEAKKQLNIAKTTINN